MRSILKNNKFILCFMLFNLLAKPVQATEISTAAISCSALFFIMTSTSMEDPDFGMKMTAGARLMHLIHGESSKEKTEGKVNSNYSSWLREKVMKAYGDKYDENPNIVVDDYIACKLWFDSLSSYMQNSSASSDINDIPKPLNNFNVGQDIKKLAITNIHAAFSAWDKFGRKTEGDIMLMLQEKVKSGEKR